eukprot:RCo049050
MLHFSYLLWNSAPHLRQRGWLIHALVFVRQIFSQYFGSFKALVSTATTVSPTTPLPSLPSSPPLSFPSSSAFSPTCFPVPFFRGCARGGLWYGNAPPYLPAILVRVHLFRCIFPSIATTTTTTTHLFLTF